MILVELIRQYKQEILEQWLATVRQQVSGAQTLETLALQDDMPDLLDDLAAGLDESTPQTVTHESLDHGKMRARFEDYTLSQVIREYRLLLEVVLDYADERVQISPTERDKTIKAITWAMEQASESFFQMKQQQEVSAKQAAEAMVEELRREGQFRDDFIGTVTHDLRNPLANTFSLVELLRSRMPEDPLLDRLLKAMQQSLTMADTLIRNLLDVNLIKSGGEVPIRRQRCDLLPEVRASIELFSNEHKADIVLNCEHSAVIGDYDCQALRRALDNLIKNAIKYGNDEEDITVTCVSADDRFITLAVHNHGSFIPHDEQAKIFTRHYRIEEKRNNKGWGIGLALVKGIAQAHDGTAEVESIPDEGTTFSIRIPVHEP